MKKNTFQRSKLFALLSVFSFCFLSNTALNAQVAQNGILYISDNSFFYMDAAITSYTFGTGTTPTVLSKSTRTITPGFTYGRLIFDDGVTHSGAANTHFFDGYVTTMSSNDFIFPIGHDGLLAQAKVNATTDKGVDAAFYKTATSAFGTSFASTSVTGLLPIGFWNIRKSTGSDANAKISLSWTAELNVDDLVTELSSLVILGWNSSTSKWVEVPSAFDAVKFTTTSTTSTLASGSITSSADVTLSDSFQFFTLGSKFNCSPVFADNGTTTKWNGSTWDNGVPTKDTKAVLEADFSGSMIANSLDLGTFKLTLANNQVLEVINGISSTAPTGRIVMASNASVIQRNESTTKPKIELTKNTRVLSRYDYTYFASPVAENVFSQLAGAYYLTSTDSNRLYNHYKMISGDHTLFGEDLVPANPYLTPWQTLTSANFVNPGQGWISSIRSMSPFLTDAFTGVISLKFTGTSNNGVITAPVVKSSHVDPDHGSHYNLLGNPYPSAISASKFLMYETNNVIDGVVYIWEAKTQPITQTANTAYYNQADYITFSRAGSTGTYVGTPSFNGNIASGQSFMVRALIDDSMVTFNNCMRMVGTTDNTSFYRSTSTNQGASTQEKIDRFKLDLTSSTGDFNQTLIAYIPGLTYGYDRGYDAVRNSNANSQLFAINNISNDRIAIDARPQFVNTDVVPLGFSTTNNLATTNFSINVVDREGLFNETDVTIYLYDSLNNLYHNFNNGAYTFTAANATVLNRFSVVYQTSTLDNPDFSTTNVIVSLNENTLNIVSKDLIKSVMIYDVAGRLVEKVAVDAVSVNNKFNHAKGVYIVQTELSNGVLVSNKVINK